jgi:hypothetical protein
VNEVAAWLCRVRRGYVRVRRGYEGCGVANRVRPGYVGCGVAMWLVRRAAENYKINKKSAGKCKKFIKSLSNIYKAPCEEEFSLPHSLSSARMANK